MTDFVNCYEDPKRAAAYASLGLNNTYYLAYRDLPAILSNCVVGTRALDFGCGTGRSTRFLEALGFTAIGIDRSEQMLSIARSTDSRGDYRNLTVGGLNQLASETFDLVLSAFTFDNIPAAGKRDVLRELARLLVPAGTFVNIVSSPEIYLREWASFTTKDFPSNRFARNGDVVRIVVTGHEDRRPVEDILCTDESYQSLYREAGLCLRQVLRPLADGEEPYRWASETRIPPWVIYVLAKPAPSSGRLSRETDARQSWGEKPGH